jgi:hypothetical protein
MPLSRSAHSIATASSAMHTVDIDFTKRAEPDLMVAVLRALQHA